MADYGLSAWRYLGAEIKSSRKQAGLRDTQEWAEKVGRSSRVLLGLERGERVGDDTLELIEDALEWPHGKCEVILAGRPMRPDLDVALDKAQSRPVGLGLDDEAADLRPEQIESVRAVIRAMKAPPENE